MTKQTIYPFLELLSRRQSTRSYSSLPVEREKITQCLEAARLAPSACNSQPWKFVVVEENGCLQEFRKAIYDPLIRMNKFALKAPVFVAIVRERAKMTAKLGSVIKEKDYSSMDIGIAAEHICLAATELGLGSCMIGWFNEDRAKKVLHIPARKTIELVIALGYATDDDKLRPKVRKKFDEVVSFNRY